MAVTHERAGSSGVQLLIAGAVLAVFWSIATYPFVQDDWLLIRQLQHSVWSTISGAFSPAGQLFYRPLGVVYVAALYQAFRLHAFWYHSAALVIHLVNCLLVSRIFGKLTGRPIAGLTTAVVYGTAVTIHLVPLVWVVGVYDLAGVCFGLLAIDRLMNDRPAASALMLLLALGTKESAISVVAVLGACQLLFSSGGAVGQRLRPLRPHALVLGIYAVAKFSGDPFRSTSASDPYFLTFRPSVIVDGAVLYARWFAQALAPIEGEARLLAIPALLAILWTAWRTYQRGDWSGRGLRIFALSAIWIAAGLAPVLGLPNHRYAYYLSYSWAPLAFVTVAVAIALIEQLTDNYRAVVSTLATWMIVATGSNIVAYRLMLAGQPVVPMAQASRLVSQLRDVIPALPHGATLVFARDIETGGFAGPYAARVLFDDDSITAYRANDVRCSGNELVARDPKTGVEQTLGPDVFWLRAEGGRLVRDTDRIPECRN